MRYFLLTLFKYLFLISIIFALFKLAILDFNRKDYLSTYSDKALAIAKTKNESRIILVGSSSSAFGISGELINKSFKKRVINFGTHGALGYKSQLEILRKYGNQNDLYLIEIPLDFELNVRNHEKHNEFILNNPRFNLINHDPVNFIKSLYFFKIGRPKNFGVYRYDCTNMFGDVITNCEDTFEFKFSLLKRKNKNSLTLIKSFKNDIFSNLSKDNVYFFLPPIIKDDYRYNSAYYDEIEKDIIKIIGDRLLNTFKISNYPIELFFDGLPHLNCKGRFIRTSGLIDSLKVRNHNHSKDLI